ncbi:MAG: hypothetical protein K6G50_01380 [bacterium]|nr:hypothetical protein [bacterium]
MNLRTVTASLICLSMLSIPAFAQDKPTLVGDTYESLQADLNRDGNPETISLVCYKKDEWYFLCQLIVKDASGNVIWEGPKPESPESDDVFGGFEYGVAEIDCVADIDGNGVPDIVGRMPQSDVRPPVWRIWKWDGQKFNRQPLSCLIETPAKSGHYLWVEPNCDLDKRYIQYINVNNGQLNASIFDFYGQQLHDLKAIIAPYNKEKRGGFSVVRWIK